MATKRASAGEGQLHLRVPARMLDELDALAAEMSAAGLLVIDRATLARLLLADGIARRPALSDLLTRPQNANAAPREKRRRGLRT